MQSHPLEYDGKRILKRAEQKELDAKLAEIIGILLGDGGLYKYHKNKITTVICFNKEEKDYLDYVWNLLSEYFYPYKFSFHNTRSEYQLENMSVYVGRLFLNAGMKLGIKTMNSVEIPSWIFEKKLLIPAIRGIFDTDGCIYRKYDDFLQVQFKFSSFSLIYSLNKALIELGFHPTKIHKDVNSKSPRGLKFYLSRQGEIDMFMKLIEPKNPKHIIRYEKIKMGTRRFERRSTGSPHRIPH